MLRLKCLMLNPIAVFVAVLLPSSSFCQAVVPRKASYEQFVTAALKVKADRDTTTSLIKQTLDDTFVLFIPGALGSKLYSASGEPIWGADVVPQLESLVFASGAPPARAEKLDAYPLGVTRIDVYGQFDSRISAAIGGTASREEFAYDWREDIDTTVDRLESKIRGDWAPRLKNKKVIIVAHSMGGVVAWHWKNKHLRQGGYDFAISKLVLLGSPLQGSCEMLRMLLTGYRPTPREGFLEEKLYKVLFSALKPAAYTFPGIFQLLPLDEPLDIKTSCLVVKDPTGLYPQRHFAIDVWQQNLFPFLEGSWFASSVWDQLRLTRNNFKERLDQTLLKARDFRRNLNLSSEDPLNGKVEYFYSNEHPTTSQIFVRGGGQIDKNEGIVVDGDGRVMKTSAINQPRYSLTPREVSSPHGDLVKDRSFIQFIDLELKKEIEIRRTIKMASILASDEGARRSFGNAGLILSLSDLGVNLAAPSRVGAEAKSILSLNTATVEALNARPDNQRFRKPDVFLAAYEYARYLDDERKNKIGALPLYETVLASGVLKGSLNEVYALNRYGYSLIYLGRRGEARPFLLSAGSGVTSSPGGYTKDFKANLENNIRAARGGEFEIQTRSVAKSPESRSW